MKKISTLFAFFVSICLYTFAQAPTSPTWTVIDNPEYETDDVPVMSYNVKDFGAVGDGITNDLPSIRSAIEKARNDGGGVVYIPAGKYRFSSKFTIPRGVTLRGDWKKPVKDQPIKGTILMASDLGRGEDRGRDDYSFITMESSTSLNNIAIWYPGQKPGDIQPYPPTIILGREGQWGNEYTNVRNVTLVNSYTGVAMSRINSGGCPNIYGLYGTVLKVGVEIDNIADVGRFDWIDLSPDYWAESGLPDAPAVGGPHEDFMYNNATGVVMRRNDWSYTCYGNFEGLNIGFHAIASPSTTTDLTGPPNGHNYKMIFKDCKTAVQCTDVSGSGIMFADMTVDNCENGLVIADGAGAAVQTSDWNINATQNAILISEKASTKVMMQGSTITNGKIDAKGGILLLSNSNVNNAAPQITIGSGARAAITGNSFANPVDIQNNSMFLCNIDHTPVAIPPTPVFEEHTAKVTKPAKNKLFIVTNYGAKPYFMANNSGVQATNDNKATQDAALDATDAIEAALADAEANGGGIVYFPAGHYKVTRPLTVPAGVEVKGTNDFRTVPMGPGSVFEIYCGEDDPTGTPFLKLSQGSGVRGMVFNYPKQEGTLAPEWKEYPYTIQGMGSDIYVVNVGIRASMHGLDLFTNKCDNHYVDYLCGHVFKTGVRVGGGSDGGTISNTQFNTLVYSGGHETKFGSWVNSPDRNAPQDEKLAREAMCYNYNWEHLEFVILGNCTNQTLYNIFHYGSQRGLILGDDTGSASGISMGTAIDASRKSITFNDLGSEGFPLINTQVVSTTGSNQNEPTTFLELATEFAGTAQLFNSDYWGNTNTAITANNGNIELYQSHFSNSGNRAFASLGDGGHLKVINSNIANNGTLLNPAAKAPQAIIESSVVNAANTNTSLYESWENNLSIAPVFVGSDIMLPQTGWIADSFNKVTNINDDKDPRRAIDNNVNTRWSTGSDRAPGQWFSVNTIQPVTFNKIILDAATSSNDGPVGYEVYITNDPAKWGTDPSTWGTPVETGHGSGVTIVSIPTTEAQYVGVVQTGTQGGWWSIHEFDLGYVAGEAINPGYTSESQAVYIADDALYFEGFDSDAAEVTMYSISGQKVFSTTTTLHSGVEISLLPNGIYIVEIEQNGKIYRGKVIKK